MLAGCCCSASGGLQVHCELRDSEDCDKNNGFCLESPTSCLVFLVAQEILCKLRKRRRLISCRAPCRCTRLADAYDRYVKAIHVFHNSLFKH